ncbi:MAG: hypothetical protein EBV29_02685 [Gammaproteobacteria bacterium]|nr:hypothetical protein [Gammaproteobacteria bacterium]
MRGLNRRWSSLPIAALFAALAGLPQALTAQTAQSVGADLPDIGSGANSTMTLNDEYQLGLMVVRGLRDQGLILEDPEVTDYIQTLGSRIVAHIPESEQRYTFFVVREGGINAFALPGGFIGVNYGLITATANESQLASVIAHEIAHVKQRHIARAIQAQGRSTMASAAAMVAAIVIGMATGTPDAMQAGMAIAQGTAMQQQINFTRANEYEADRVGIGFLAAAGFDPNAMPDFFETIGRRSGLAGIGVPELLRTHPVTSNRIAESRDRLALYKKVADPSRSTPHSAMARPSPASALAIASAQRARSSNSRLRSHKARCCRPRWDRRCLQPGRPISRDKRCVVRSTSHRATCRSPFATPRFCCKPTARKRRTRCCSIFSTMCRRHPSRFA